MSRPFSPSQTQYGPSVPVRGGGRLGEERKRLRGMEFKVTDNIFFCGIASEKKIVEVPILINDITEPS